MYMSYGLTYTWHDFTFLLLTFICLGLLYRMTLRTEPSDRDVRTRSALSRNVDLGKRYVTVSVVSLVAGRNGGKRDNDKKKETYPFHL
jgi:hypothetical protein